MNKTERFVARSIPSVTIVLLSSLLGCAQPPEPAAPPPPEVEVEQPTRRTVTLFDEFVGTTRASESVEIRARVSGTLEQITFKPSHPVEKGETLFVIEPRPYQALLDEATASLSSADAELANAESEFERRSVAIKTNAISQSDLDQSKAQRDKALAAVLLARAKLDQAELQHSYTRVEAPISGQVGRSLVDAGNVVSGSERTLLTTVNRMRPLHVYFDAPEEGVLRALRADIGLAERFDQLEPKAVFLATLADEGYPFEGSIDFIGNTVDADTGTIQLRAVIDNDDLQLFPGLFVRIRVPVEDLEQAILVDEKAVGTDLGGRYLYLVGNDNLVEQRYVTLGPVQDDGMIPILEGLQGDETYIVGGMLRARPGMPVTPREAS